MKYIVLGGAGAMGRITVRDLFETDPKAEILIADYNQEAAEQLASSFRSPRIKACFANVKDHDSLIQLLKGSFVVINSTQYQFNLNVMEAALSAGVHYVDLGGLFHMTRKQLELHDRFKNANLLALLGMGAAPGVTNIMAAHAASQMEEVREIHCRLGAVDLTRYTQTSPLSVSYSLKTILDEFSFKPAFFSKGRFCFVEPMSGANSHRFPPPVGIQRPMHTIHSEVATLPLTYKKKGVREVSFKIAFDDDFTNKVRFLRDLGIASEQPVEIGGGKVVPRDLLLQLVSVLPKEKTNGSLKQYEVVRSVVKGRKKGKKVTMVVDCHAVGMPEWGIGLDIDTGAPPSIAAQMLVRGEINGCGVLPPETVVPSDIFFKALKRRKMMVKSRQISGWDFAV
ncbi:MAG: saccharopine dehydrogenase NADP-binding domain-containing protein [Deltaproteobacteria bacterium]|nr:saccharopine dehydrogenase NADP-binding domain-containing protein [Deltaproteobacteria bacterium]